MAVGPMVLMHGLFGFEQITLGPIKLRYFRGIERAVTRLGCAWLAPRVPPTAPIRRRAAEARGQILAWMKQEGLLGQKLIVVGHSMGGLDARYMISQLGMDEHVRALLTIASPHRGSPLADFWMENRPMQHVGLPLLGLAGIDGQGGNDLTRAAMRQFNLDVPDAPGVRYFSIAGDCPVVRVPLILQPGWWIIHKAEGANDGMVSVQSALWGELLDTWPLHHLHQVNHRLPIDALAPVKNVAPLYAKAIRQAAQRCEADSAPNGKIGISETAGCG